MLERRRALLSNSKDVYDWIDMCGIKVATRNIGAAYPGDAGLFFAWGETEGYTEDLIGSGELQRSFSLENYKWYDSLNDVYTKYNNTDYLTRLLPEDDAAAVNMGSKWRMPTSSDARIICNTYFSFYPLLYPYLFMISAELGFESTLLWYDVQPYIVTADGGNGWFDIISGYYFSSQDALSYYGYNIRGIQHYNFALLMNDVYYPGNGDAYFRYVIINNGDAIGKPDVSIGSTSSWIHIMPTPSGLPNIYLYIMLDPFYDLSEGDLASGEIRTGYVQITYNGITDTAKILLKRTKYAPYLYYYSDANEALVLESSSNNTVTVGLTNVHPSSSVDNTLEKEITINVLEAPDWVNITVGHDDNLNPKTYINFTSLSENNTGAIRYGTCRIIITSIDGNPVTNQMDPFIIVLTPTDYDCVFNGYPYTDMGNGIAWGVTNLNASDEVADGSKYRYGEVSEYIQYGQNPSYNANIYSYEISGTSDDAAIVNRGGIWRMPTRDEVFDLLSEDYSEFYRCKYKGKYALVIISKINNNCIILPYCNYYDYQGHLSFSESINILNSTSYNKNGVRVFRTPYISLVNSTAPFLEYWEYLWEDRDLSLAYPIRPVFTVSSGGDILE